MWITVTNVYTYIMLLPLSGEYSWQQIMWPNTVTIKLTREKTFVIYWVHSLCGEIVGLLNNNLKFCILKRVLKLVGKTFTVC